jgi:hypothetical protein
VTGVDVLAWNAHLGNRRVARALRRLTRKRAGGKPHVIALFEVPFRHGQIRRWARRHGYVMYAEEPGDRTGRVVSERGSTVVLVRGDVHVIRARVVVGKQGWRVVSKNRPHDPRRDWMIRLRHGGTVYRLYVPHVATGGPNGPSRAAVLEWGARVRRGIQARRAGIVYAAVGDLNDKLPNLRARFPDARVVGRTPDAAIVAGGHVTRQVLGKHGSDHHAIRYRLDPKE